MIIPGLSKLPALAIFSLDSETDNYIIEAMLDDCSQEHCYSKCKNLPCINLCYHMYQCSCSDYHNGHICKHIHKIHSLSSVSDTTVRDSDENEVQLCHPNQQLQNLKKKHPKYNCSELITFSMNSVIRLKIHKS